MIINLKQNKAQEPSISIYLEAKLEENLFYPEKWALKDLVIRYQCLDGCDDCSSNYECVCKGDNFLEQQTKKCTTSCPQGQFRDKSQPQLNQICTDTCPSGYFGDNSQTLCVKCEFSCKECFNETKQGCKSCQIGILQPDYTCQKKCLLSDQFYDEQTNSCIKCQDYCLKCENSQTCQFCDIANKEKNVNQIDSLTCFVCELNEYYDNSSKTCQKCHSTCRSCVGKNENECSTCFDAYFQTPQNRCVTSCPTGLIENLKTKKCQKCVYINQICSLECPYGYYEGYEQQCLQCSDNCNKCESQYNCLECLTPYSLKLTQDPNIVIHRYQCSICYKEQGQYINSNGICNTCDDNCLQCSTEKSCQLCKFKYEIIEGKCVFNTELYLNIDCDNEETCKQQRNIIKYMKIPSYALVLSSVLLYLWGLVNSDKQHICLNCIYLMQSIGNYSIYQSSLSYNGLGTVILKSLNHVNVLNIFPRPQFVSDLQLKDKQINKEYRLLSEDRLEILNQDISNYSFISRMLYFPFFLIILISLLYLLFHFRKISKMKAKYHFINGILFISNYGLFSLLICLKHIISNRITERYAIEIPPIICFAMLLSYTYFILFKLITSNSFYSLVQGYDLNENISWSKYFWIIYDLRRFICIVILALISDINIWKIIIIISINFIFFTIIAIWRLIKTYQNFVFFMISELVQIFFLLGILFATEMESYKQYIINATILILFTFLSAFLLIIVFNVIKYSKKQISSNKQKTKLLEALNDQKHLPINNLMQSSIIKLNNVKWIQNPTTKNSSPSP